MPLPLAWQISQLMFVNVLQRRSEMIYAAKLNWEQHLKDVEAKRVHAHTCSHTNPRTHSVSLSQLKQLEAAERSVLKRLRNESIVQHEAQRAQVPLVTHVYAILYIADLACVRRP